MGVVWCGWGALDCVCVSSKFIFKSLSKELMIKLCFQSIFFFEIVCFTLSLSFVFVFVCDILRRSYHHCNISNST